MAAGTLAAGTAGTYMVADIRWPGGDRGSPRREMRDAQQGFVIQKVTEKHGKTEVQPLGHQGWLE